MSSSVSFPRRCALPADLVFGCRRLGPTGCPRGTSSGGVGVREPLPAKAVGPVPGAEGQASTGRRFHPLDAGGPESMVRLARRAGAPPRIPPLLALEVEDDRPTAPAHPLPRVAPRDGGRQSHLGDRNASPTSCHCNWESGFPPHGREGSAPWRNGAHARLQAALAHQATAGMERAAWRPLQQATRPWSVTFRNERWSK